MYSWDFSIIYQHSGPLLSGLAVTLGITAVSVICGMILGTLIGIVRLGSGNVGGGIIYALTEVFRCTPVLVQLIWIYYALPILSGISLSAVAAALLTLSLYGAAFYAEVFRGGIQSIDRGQWDAAHALGISKIRIMRHLILPQAVRVMTPALVNQTILQLKNSALVSVIAVPDLLFQAEQVTALSFRPLEVYSIIAATYFVILFPITLVVRALERRFARAA